MLVINYLCIWKKKIVIEMISDSNYAGLTEAEVAESRIRHGINILTPPEKESLFKLFLDKF